MAASIHNKQRSISGWQLVFSFASLEASRKTPWDIDKLQISDMGLDKNPAPCCKKCPESLSMPVAIEISIF